MNVKVDSPDLELSNGIKIFLKIEKKVFFKITIFRLGQIGLRNRILYGGIHTTLSLRNELDPSWYKKHVGTIFTSSWVQ